MKQITKEEILHKQKAMEPLILYFSIPASVVALRTLPNRKPRQRVKTGENAILEIK